MTTILVADDDPEVRALVRVILEGDGYTVHDAPDGPSALQVAAGLSTPLHLLLSDVVMPGMSGPELAARLAAQRPETKVVYMSGFALTVGPPDAGGGEVAIPAGAPILPKPFTRDRLLAKIREVLAARPAAPSPFARRAAGGSPGRPDRADPWGP